MAESPNGSSFWSPKTDALVAFVVYFATQVVAGDALLRLGLEESIVLESLMMIAGFASVAVFAGYRRSELAGELQPRASCTCYLLFLVIWMPFAFWLYPSLAERFGYELATQEVLTFLANDPELLPLSLVALLACIAAPIGEELLFRGFLFKAFETQLGGRGAIVVTAVLFGALHEPSAILPIVLLGLLFGYIRWKTGGVASSILIHIVHNSWTVAVTIAFPDNFMMLDR